jgi:orotidine-5'-phosphate decarboxylase
LSPYMGEDSIEPYLNYKNHSVFLLAYTSNPSSNDLQKLKSQSGKFFYEEVISFSKKLNDKYKNQVGIVVGATHRKELKEIREKDQNQVFLIPGFGAQGGNLEEIIPVCGKNSLINSSRSIIFASNQSNFQDRANEEAKKIHNKMNELL